MRRTMMRCDRCGKEINISYALTFQAENGDGILVHDSEAQGNMTELDQELHKNLNTDLCHGCAQVLVEDVTKIFAAYAREREKAGAEKDVGTGTIEEKIKKIVKDKKAKGTKKKRNEYIKTGKKIDPRVKNNPVEMYGKVYALKNAGWTSVQIADEFGEKDDAKNFMGRYYYYVKNHPDIVEQWQG